MKKWRNLIIEAITDTLLIVLPGDLLYLYFAGGWYEPAIWLLVLEMLILPCIALLGIWRVVRFIQGESSQQSRQR